MQTQPRRITIAHSPDSDDAFMFYVLAKGLIDTDGLEVVEELQDIESLNQRCLRAELELSAASVHAYAYFSERYAVLPCGASLGEGYGPRVVSREPVEIETLSGRTVAIPGMLTSAALALRGRARNHQHRDGCEAEDCSQPLNPKSHYRDFVHLWRAANRYS